MLPIAERMQASERAAPLAMRFHGTTPAEARQWQTVFGAKLRSLLGPIDPPSKWTCTLERRIERSDHVREEQLLTADGLAPVPFHLLLPRDGKQPAGGKRAGILAIHGHGEFVPDIVAGIDDTPQQQAEIERFKYDYGRQLVQQGYVVAVPGLTPFGRRLGIDKKSVKTDPCTVANLQLEQLGKLLIAENLRDILWTFAFLTQHAAVDRERIGCVGLSLGGRMTTLAAAVEPRIKVAVIAGALNCLQERAMVGKTAGCQVIPGLLQYGDIPEIAGLIAPRPCVWQVGSRDPHLPADWTSAALGRLEPIYAAFGAADQLIVDRFEGGHEWHGDKSCAVIAQALKS
ncbi:MAG TPA: alpha/beta hydrolase family protein [Pirellulales bacterium]|nr:alpha/beta hydrolase family protein [Pirellulales bacterium]